MRRLLIVATSLLTVAAGCGDDDASGGDGDASPDVAGDVADVGGGDTGPDVPLPDAGDADAGDGGSGDAADTGDADAAADTDDGPDGGDGETDGGDADDGEAGDLSDGEADTPEMDGGGVEATDGEAGDADAVDTDEGDVDATDGEAGDADAVDTDEGDAGPDADAGCVTAADCPDPGPCAEVGCGDSGQCEVTPLEDGLPCDDGNACSAGDTCQAGVCTGGAAVTCDDGNPCTDDLCVPAEGCTHQNNFATCDDGDPCTEGDRCEAGECVGPEAACDDDNPCTVDTCDPATGTCEHVADDDLTCSDGSECTLGDHCLDGDCVPGSTDGCEDDNACTDDVCQEGTCAHIVLHGIPCEDGDACSVDDVCSAGHCAPGAQRECDDGNPCTADSCDPVTGCEHTAMSGEACEDGDACTVEDTCDAEGTCVPGAPLDCSDGNPCTSTACDAETGCTFDPVDGGCDDGDICTEEDICSGTECVGMAKTCDDGDACTRDTCDPVLGCQHVDTSGECVDDSPCTDDACDPKVGCVFTPNDDPCDDGDACTVGDTCVDGVCASEPLDCDDGDPCTWDVCDPEEGCVNEPFTGPCEDGDACTEGETCGEEGVCVGGTPVDPDDGVACTVDACDPASGPVHEPDWSACEVGQVCDPTNGCVEADMHLVVSKLMLLPEDPAVGAGQGQWLALTNVGEGAIDVSSLRVVNSQGGLARVRAASGDPEAPVVVPPGATVAGIKAPPDGAEVPDGFTFVYGQPDDTFALRVTGDILTFLDGPANLVGVLDFSLTAEGPEVPQHVLPVVPGAPTELDAAVLAEASGSGADDDLAAWCAWPAGSGAPEEPTLDCGRVRLNEVGLAGPDGARWLELHAPSGASLDGLTLRVLDPAGALLTTLSAGDGRAPIGALPVRVDAEDGVALPAMGEGSVQLLRQGALIDVYGFGALETEVDDTGLPLVEGTAGPILPEGAVAIRSADGVDTDDNAADWELSDTGSPGEPNP
ncbi:MAG: hypothetical protein ACQEXJ_15210 [Myxococcota bacterium]